MDAFANTGEAVTEAVSIDGLTVERDGRRLFTGLTCSVPQGSFLAVTGPSGAGKSSLLACLHGTLEPISGKVDLKGARGQKLGTVFQHLRLTRESSVLTNVLCGRLGSSPWWRTLLGFGQAEKQEAFAVLNALGLGPLAFKPVRRTSGGEQQRTAIARVLYQAPEVILADEPTSNLDHALAVRVMERLRGLCDRGECTVIAVLHDRDLVERFADAELMIGAGPENWKLIRIRH